MILRAVRCRGSIAPREAFDVILEVDATDLPPGELTDEIAFLTNNPTTPVVRYPLTLSVSPVASETDVPEAFTMAGVDPNPVGGVGRVRFALAEAADVSVSVFDALGRRVRLVSEGAGSRTVTVDVGDLPSGVYSVRVAGDGERIATPLTVVR